MMGVEIQQHLVDLRFPIPGLNPSAILLTGCNHPNLFHRGFCEDKIRLPEVLRQGQDTNAKRNVITVHHNFVYTSEGFVLL